MEAVISQFQIVSSNVAGTRDLIKHMDNGTLCEADNYNCINAYLMITDLSSL